MNRPHATIPGHAIALAALAAVAALFAYALNDRGNPSRAFTIHEPRAPITRIDPESWTRSQQKVLGTARVAAREPLAAADFTDRPIARTVTHVGVAPRRAETTRDASAAYAGASLASLPPPGD